MLFEHLARCPTEVVLPVTDDSLAKEVSAQLGSGRSPSLRLEGESGTDLAHHLLIGRRAGQVPKYPRQFRDRIRTKILVSRLHDTRRAAPPANELRPREAGVTDGMYPLHESRKVVDDV